MKVKIYQLAKTAMQSGKRNSKKWLLEPIPEINSRSINPLMGWVSSNDMNSQLRFEFSSKEEAIKFAENQSFEFEIYQPQIASIKKKSYAENFTN